jgi:hypothetical protein
MKIIAAILLIALFVSCRETENSCGSALSEPEIIRILGSELRKRAAGRDDPLKNTKLVIGQDGCDYTVLVIYLPERFGKHTLARVTRSGKVVQIVPGV